MHSRKTAARTLTVAASAALALALSACGGGSDAASSAVMPTLAAPKSCANVTGSLDVLQTTLLSQLRPAVQGIPTVGASAASATTALSQTLDTVDALSNALTSLATTQNPQQFTSQLSGAGDSILCSGSSLSNSLALLSSSQSLPIPGVAEAQQTLALATQRVADGLVGSTPGADLTLLTNQLVTLSIQLRSVSNSLPAGLNQPYLKEILALNATAFNSLALILGDVGALNGTKLATDVTALLTAGASSLQVPFATQFGVPASALSPVTAQFINASGAISTGLGSVAGPTLQAVSAVLGAGSAAGSFSDLLDGGLAGGGSAASIGRVTQLTQQLGGTGGLSLVTALLQSFGGLLPR